jgi:hypothetical protein
MLPTSVEVEGAADQVGRPAVAARFQAVARAGTNSGDSEGDGRFIGRTSLRRAFSATRA